MVEWSWRSKGSAQGSLVTDDMTALGQPPGHYLLGAFEVLVDEAVATVTAVPSRALRLAARGHIRVGQKADMTLQTAELRGDHCR